MSAVPGTLALAQKARMLVGVNKPARLYRAICKEIPRILTIYDIDMPLVDARVAVRGHLADNAMIRDDRVIDMVVEKGYMELEETLLQHKQRPHLLRILEGNVVLEGSNRKKLALDTSADEQFARN